IYPLQSTLQCLFFFNHPATTAIYTLSLHDALPISRCPDPLEGGEAGGVHVELPLEEAERERADLELDARSSSIRSLLRSRCRVRSEEHTSELQSRRDLVCRLLLEKKNKVLKKTQLR